MTPLSSSAVDYKPLKCYLFWQYLFSDLFADDSSKQIDVPLIKWGISRKAATGLRTSKAAAAAAKPTHLINGKAIRYKKHKNTKKIDKKHTNFIKSDEFSIHVMEKLFKPTNMFFACFMNSNKNELSNIPIK